MRVPAPKLTLVVPTSEPMVVLFPFKLRTPPFKVTAVVVGKMLAAFKRKVPAETVVVPL